MKKLISRSLLVAGVLALSLPQAFATGSEFIDDMPQVTQDPDRPGAMTWVKPGVDRTAYTRVMLEPITIFISLESEYKGISSEELGVLSSTFIETITKTLEPEVPVVHQGGAGVLYVRAPLNNVKLAIGATGAAVQRHALPGEKTQARRPWRLQVQ